MFVVIEMDGGYSEDDVYVGRVFGPFRLEKEALKWLKETNKGYSYTVHEVIPYQ